MDQAAGYNAHVLCIEYKYAWCAGMQAAEGIGQADEAKRRAQKFLGTGEDAEDDEDADTAGKHPEDFIEGIEV